MTGTGSGDGERDPLQDEEDAVTIPITGELDLHPFAPRDVASVVREYVKACQERNVLALRLVHGKGTGAQRAMVRRILLGLPAVASFGDAPAERGGFGATLVTLFRCAGSQDLQVDSQAGWKPHGTGVPEDEPRSPASLLAKRNLDKGTTR